MEHPRDRLQRSAGFSRREFLKRSAGAALAVTGAGAVLAACQNSSSAGRGGASTPASLPLARPDHPVKWPIFSDNQAIVSGMQPEKGATLQLYNWVDYIYKKVVDDFAAQYDCKVNINTFNTMDEAIAKIRAGQQPFDVFFPTPDVVGKLVEFKYLRPLNHSYIPNIDQVWPQFQNPFYDEGWQYTVPYTIYTTGIAWRTDHVSTDVGSMSNPYDIFWDTKYKGEVELLDDYREVISMVLLKNGITNVNTCSQSQLNMVRNQLVQLAHIMDPRVAISDYSDLPSGKVWITQAWSGDMINSQYYGPKGFDPGILQYWYQPKVAPTFNDMMAILSSGQNPVLSHLFLNYMLDYRNAMKNFSWNGYQPPQRKVNPSLLVQQGYIPKNLSTAVVTPEQYDTGSRELELPPSCDAAWHTVWTQFQAGG